ncbi:NADP-dependent oxidoreductase domain-containing protein [Suillus bovinus]|uniref:NADP-dependent oxidoreductase domain-containing protein n=1 Tax=Suillus bovinus TaxID=48563 RepID=UPI001B8818FF|nr:NADP-dependent oxidoreductase domain-containing protein [Suillus bovinus]KAG2132316.1 NADP-dependent oxidoreductase domain-containing protein [Suillus bovinus]
MPWDSILLNSGYSIPSLAYGTGGLGSGQWPIDQLTQAFDTGFYHIDTAQLYRNEAEVGITIGQLGLERSDVFITTKFSGFNGLDIPTSIQNSLEYLNTSYVDLYLIHSPDLAVPDIPTVWAQMEKVQEAGLARSIGVSNFNEKQLEILLSSAKIRPAANQIYLHPYNYQQQSPTLEYAAKYDIVIEAYGALTPVTREPGGPVDAPLNEIATRLGATTEQVLLAWIKAKGAVVVTTSSKKARLLSYLSAGNLELSAEDVKTIDTAGAIGEKRITVRHGLPKLGVGIFLGILVLVACSYFKGRGKRRNIAEVLRGD